MRAYGWRTRNDVLRGVLIGIGFGVSISLIESGGTKMFPPLHTFIRNSIFGVVIIMIARGAETLLSRRIERSRYPTIVRSMIYAVAGWASPAWRSWR